ncbi:MAG: hypothetical protein JW726_07530 [Anaerolineales bacterium]|nr:hypothetical protein [Anaerolineales bacterium]
MKQPDDWFGLRYNMNLYRGCQHQCIYCDSRSVCYQIENFVDILVKVNGVELLRDALPRKRQRGTVGTGSMNDPYMPVERKYRLTGQALEVIADNCFPVHILTKSDLVLRDLDTLRKINEVFAAVSFTITTADDMLAKKLEPGAPPPSARFAAMRALAGAGIATGVMMMPILPFLEDTEENITQIVEQAADCGARYILPSMGMTLREGSREYFYTRLDEHFPGVREKYERRFGLRYECYSPQAKALYARLGELCGRYGIASKMPLYTPQKVVKGERQMRLL